MQEITLKGASAMYYQYDYEAFRVQQAARLEEARRQQQAAELLAALAAQENQRGNRKPKRR